MSKKQHPSSSSASDPVLPTGEAASPPSSDSDLPPEPIRSPFLDWILAIRRHWWLVGSLGAGGFVLFSALAQLQPVNYVSETILITQPALLGPTAGQVVEVPGAAVIQPLVASQIFEKVVGSRDVIDTALTEMESLGYDNLVQLDMTDLLESDPPPSKEEIREKLIEYVHMQRISFAYDQIDPTIRFVVGAPGSAKYARDLASSLIKEANAKIGRIRSGQRDVIVGDVADSRGQIESELRKAETAFVQFQLENRLAQDPATTQKRRELEDQIESKRNLYEQLKRVEDKLLYTERRFAAPAAVVDGPSLPYRPVRLIPTKLAALAGGMAGVFVAFLWMAYAMHLEQMRALNPSLYGGRRSRG